MNMEINYVKDLSELIDNSIPNFKSGWLEIGRYINSDNSRWLNNLNPLIECVGTGHYTVLKSLNYIRLSRCISNSYINDNEQRFKNIFFHFGIITDCCKQISRSIVLIKSNLRLIEYKEEKLEYNEIKQNLKSWYESKYDSQYKEMQNYGISVNINIQPESDIYFNILDKEKNYTKNYFIFRNAIQSYRNAYIHNPMIDVFYYKKNEYVIDTNTDKKAAIKLNKYRYLSQLDKLDTKYFIHPQELIDRNFKLLLQGLNSLWDLFSQELKTINSHPDIENILYKTEDE